jgi:predicted secreted acid phosphatase
MSVTNGVVFLLDVDNTLLDNDHIVADLSEHLAREFGDESWDFYWAKSEQENRKDEPDGPYK